MLLLRLAMRPWRLSPLSQIFSALAVGFLLIMAGFLYWMQSGLKPVLNRLKHEQVITAYLVPALEAREETQIVDSIQGTIGAHPGAITELKLMQPKQFVEAIKKQYPELGKELEDLGADLSTVVPRYITVSGLLPDTALEDVRSLKGVASAESSRDRFHQILSAFSVLRWVAKVMALGLCLALLTGLIHLSRMNSYLHRDAVALLRHWGGHHVMLRIPGLLSGLSVGLAGGLIAFIGWASAGLWFASHVRGLSPMLREMPASGLNISFVLLLVGMAIGLLAGIFGNAAAPAAREGRS